MSDTPRTDAAQWDSYVDVDVSRTLERELAAAKGEIDLLGSAADKFRAMWRNEVQDLIREKDQLHAEVERLRFALTRIAGRCDTEAAYKIARAALKETK